MAEKKNDSFDWRSPLVIYGALGVIALIFSRQLLGAIKKLFDSFASDPGVVSQETLPLAPESITGRITGRIVSPTIGDTVTRSGATSFTYPMDIELTNPFQDERQVLVEIETKELPNLMPETGAKLSERVTLKPGRNLLKLAVRAAAVVNIGVTVPAYAQLFIDGRPAVQVVNYEIE